MRYSLLSIPLFFHFAQAVTVHNTLGTAKPIQTVSTGSYNGPQAFNPIVLTPPPVPSPPPSTNFNLPLQDGNDAGLSIRQSGSFFGFSIEFAVAGQIIGPNGTIIQSSFLNLMSNLQQRSGRVNLRIGGSSSDFASLVPTLGSGQSQAVLYGTASPAPLVFTPGFLYLLSNVSALVNAHWYLAIPFNSTGHPRLGIAAYGEAILGDRLAGLQVGDEPDLYASEGIRNYSYSPADYSNEFGELIQTMENSVNTTIISNLTTGVPANVSLARASKLLMGPNIASGEWTPEMVWNTGFVDKYQSNLAALGVEHYPATNCFVQSGKGLNISPQEIFPDYLNHTSGIQLLRMYLNSAKIARAAGKPLLMLETNSASCGGFPGVSDSFGASLWAVDYALQMAYSNFSGAFFHVNGQNASYNAFTAPPPLSPSSRLWTVGPLYYSALVTAEVLGNSNVSQVLDLRANNDSIYTPAYGIYENGKATRVALFNYISDSTGASDYTANITVSSFESGKDTTPPLVSVKYLSASSVAQKGDFTWAGQTFGGLFESNGIPQGQESIQTVQCLDNICSIKVPAPGLALVFLTDSGLEESVPGAAKTYATTVSTHILLSATVDPSVLATSNGRKRVQGHLGSTSRGDSDQESGAAQSMVLPSIMVLVGLVSGTWYLSW